MNPALELVKARVRHARLKRKLAKCPRREVPTVKLNLTRNKKLITKLKSQLV